MKCSLLVAILTIFSIAFDAKAADLKIDASGDANGRLFFQIENLGTRKLEFYDVQLPWFLKMPFLMALSVDKLDLGTGRITDLERSFWNAVSPAEKISIDPGNSVRGEVPISSQFPEVENLDENTEYYIHWTYGLKVCEEQLLYVHAGTARKSNSGLSVESQKTIVQSGVRACNNSNSQ
jgi:hypothetical protein